MFFRRYLHGLKSNTERLKEQQQKHGQACTSVYHETRLYPVTTTCRNKVLLMIQSTESNVNSFHR